MGRPAAASPGGGLRRPARGQSEEKKTLYWYTRLGQITVTERIFTQGRRGGELRPFATAAEVVCRGCSIALQRAITDFGADGPFAAAAVKLREHYGIDVPVSTVRATTERHGATMRRLPSADTAAPVGPGVERLIVEMDGSLVPRVDTTHDGAAEAPRDGRKRRRLSWVEARLCLAHAPGSVTPRFGGTLGDVTAAGDQLRACAVAAGGGPDTQVHAVGDGAVWITEQVERVFGAQARYLLDFYHLCDYLAAAADAVAGPDPRAWMDEKKTWLKANRWPEVLTLLRPAVESDDVAEDHAPVRACVRYLTNRTAHVDYQAALAAGLPIGSGEIESAHRYILQSRLKRAGAWWTFENLQNMLALRLLRANGAWEEYWHHVDQAA